MAILNWKATKSDNDLAVDIADRAERLLARIPDAPKIERRDIMMDILAVHLNDHRLDLEGLLYADDGNFGHDVFGIVRHLDRETGKLQDCFVPRYARGKHGITRVRGSNERPESYL